MRASTALPTSAPQALRVLAAALLVVVALVVGSAATEAETTPEYRRYVAMGDSYTAAPYVPLTDVAYGCLRSSNNYPHLVAAALKIEELRDRSCSGARTADLRGTQVTARGMQVPPQMTALTPDTDLVTLGIGANNYRLYARLATVCRKTRGICPLADQRATFDTILDQLRPELVRTIGEVRERSPDARVLLVSYPRLLPASGDCVRLPRMRPVDRTTFREVNLRLREEMRAAAKEAEVEFVDFYAASLGHDVCSREPWIQGRVGSARRGAALHPLPAGQAALARLVEDVLSTPPPTR